MGTEQVQSKRENIKPKIWKPIVGIVLLIGVLTQKNLGLFIPSDAEQLGMFLWFLFSYIFGIYSIVSFVRQSIKK